MGWTGMGRRRLERVMRRRWQSADAPPWGTLGALEADAVERAKAALLRPHLAGAASVLDCGCGGGDFLRLADPERRVARAVGVDVAEQAIVRAERGGRYAELHCGHIEDVVARLDEKFDAVLLGEVLYYIRDYGHALDRALDRIAPGGVLFLAMAVGRNYFWKSDLAAIRAQCRARGLAPVCDERVDYRVLGLPKRWFFPWFPQDSKQVLVCRA